MVLNERVRVEKIEECGRFRKARRFTHRTQAVTFSFRGLGRIKGEKNGDRMYVKQPSEYI
jgi:hypothetical protein